MALSTSYAFLLYSLSLPWWLSENSWEFPVSSFLFFLGQICTSLDNFFIFCSICRGGGYPPATEYVNHADRSTNNLVEAFSNMKMDEESLENGDIDHDV